MMMVKSIGGLRYPEVKPETQVNRLESDLLHIQKLLPFMCIFEKSVKRVTHHSKLLVLILGAIGS